MYPRKRHVSWVFKDEQGSSKTKRKKGAFWLVGGMYKGTNLWFEVFSIASDKEDDSRQRNTLMNPDTECKSTCTLFCPHFQKSPQKIPEEVFCLLLIPLTPLPSPRKEPLPNLCCPDRGDLSWPLRKEASPDRAVARSKPPSSAQPQSAHPQKDPEQPEESKPCGLLLR